MTLDEQRFELLNHDDVVQARQRARQLARELGFGLTDQTRIATAVSEVARQTLSNQGRGKALLRVVASGIRLGLECICLSAAWFEQPTDALRRGMLGAIERLMDEFELEPRDEEDVAIVTRKWLR